MLDRDTVLIKVGAALRDALEDDTLAVRPEDHLVDDLGFDSVKMASLTIALEDAFGDVLLLNEWIAAASSPSDLTVASLVDYLLPIVGESD